MLLNDYAKYFNIDIPLSKPEERINIAYICMIEFIEKFCKQYIWTNYASVNNVARALLITLLETKNDLEKVFGEYSYFLFKPSSFINDLNEDHVIRSRIKVDNKLSETKRKLFQKLLSNWKETYKMTVVPNNYGAKGLIYYIPYPNALLFAFEYIYLSIKVKEDKKYKVLQTKRRVDISKVFTSDENTLKTLLLKTLNNFSKENQSENIEDRIFDIYQLKSIDKNYSFFKINRMVQRIEEINVESTFKRMYERFDLKYNEVVELEKTFKEEIFYNKNFIRYCLDTDFHDPLYIFNIVLNTFSEHRYNMLNDPLKNQFIEFFLENNQHLDPNDVYKFYSCNLSFREFLSFCKTMTKSIIDKMLIIVNRRFKTDIEKTNFYRQNITKFSNDKNIANLKNCILRFTERTDSKHAEESSSKISTYNIIFYGANDSENVKIKEEKNVNTMYWSEYYFDNRERLKKYAYAETKDENDYMTFLFNIVATSLPKN